MYQDRQDNDFSRHVPPPIDETFDPVAREPGRPSPNPSVTPITGSPVFHPYYYRFLLRLSRNTFFPLFPFRKKEESEPNRGASITRKDRHDEGRHVHVPIAHAGYRIRRARLPPPCFTGVLLRGASRGCSRLQVHLALPLRSEETSVSAACIVIE